MSILLAKIRQEIGRKVKGLRQKGVLPAVLYGAKIKKSLPLEVDFRDFEKIYKEAKGSGLISIKTEKEEFSALIHSVSKDPLTGNPIHVDFYQPDLEKEIDVKIPLVFEGEALAVKDLGGTFVKYASDIHVKARPQNLPKEIRVDISSLKTFEDTILVKDLQLPAEVKILKDSQDIIASVAVPQKVVEEAPKPVAEVKEGEAKEPGVALGASGEKKSESAEKPKK